MPGAVIRSHRCNCNNCSSMFCSANCTRCNPNHSLSSYATVANSTSRQISWPIFDAVYSVFDTHTLKLKKLFTARTFCHFTSNIFWRVYWRKYQMREKLLGYYSDGWLVGWSLTSLFSTNIRLYQRRYYSDTAAFVSVRRTIRKIICTYWLHIRSDLSTRQCSSNFSWSFSLKMAADKKDAVL